MSLLQSIIKH